MKQTIFERNGRAHGGAGRAHADRHQRDTWLLIRDEFACSDLGEAEVKGFGTQRIYSLDSETSGRFA